MVSKDNLNILKKINDVLDVQRVLFTKDYEKLLGPELSKIAKKNASKILVYKIIYRSEKHKVVGFIIEPKTGTNLPCVIYNRGGSGEFGALKAGMLFTKLPAELALRGYIVIASQYSGNAGSEGKDEMGGSDINDVLNLQKILKKYTRADSRMVGMYGISRGGMMTYLALAKVPWIRAAVTVGGSANLVREEELRPEMKKLNEEMFGGGVPELEKRSAVFWPHMFSKKTPLLLLHGGSDWRVSPLDSLELAEKLSRYRIPYRLILFEGTDHSLSEHEDETSEMVFSWFDRFLKKDESLPNTKPHGV